MASPETLPYQRLQADHQRGFTREPQNASDWSAGG